jgi:hypothetical protein
MLNVGGSVGILSDLSAVFFGRELERVQDERQV